MTFPILFLVGRTRTADESICVTRFQAVIRSNKKELEMCSGVYILQNYPCGGGKDFLVNVGGEMKN